MKSTKILGKIALFLVIVGGLNWGLIGVFGYDLVTALFGAATVLSRAVYILVGVSSIYVLIAMMRK